jgi:hypothetical protein
LPLRTSFEAFLLVALLLFLAILHCSSPNPFRESSSITPAEEKNQYSLGRNKQIGEMVVRKLEEKHEEESKKLLLLLQQQISST